MFHDTVFWVAMQSSLLLGLIHGVNPCGHSWLVLAPFVAGERRGWKVAALTTSFIGGTVLGCLVIGLTLGAVSANIPDAMRFWVETGTAAIIIVLGLILIVRPTLLHSHDHDHCGDDHDHHHDHPHDHDGPYLPSAAVMCGACRAPEDGHDHEHPHDHEGHGHDAHAHDHDHDHAHEGHAHHGHGHHHAPAFWMRFTGRSGLGLFILGFVNMIVPCPTLAIMYSYALKSGSAFKATSVFASYAVGTAAALAVVIFAIYKVANLMRRLEQPWIEPLIMRVAGVVTVFFGIYSLLTV